MRRLPALAATAAAAVLLAHPSSAATSGLHLKDLAGDANGINGQDTGLPVPQTATSPASVKQADILGLDVVTHFKGSGRARKAKGFTVTLRLAAPVQAGTSFLVTMDASNPCGESSGFDLGYEIIGTVSTGFADCNPASTTGSGTSVGSAELSDDKKSIVWEIDDVFKAGTKLTNFYASTSVFVLGVFDELTAPDATFVYGK